jgi:putative ATP-binding cassette transporter
MCTADSRSVPITRLGGIARVHPNLDAWRLVFPYWQSEQRWRARALLGVIVALTVGGVVILVQINDWNRAFYEALQNYDFAAFGPLLLRFCVLAALYIVAAGYKQYFTQKLEMHWRTWLTQRFVTNWLHQRVYYHLELQPQGTDNPDQRIGEDLRLFTTYTLDLAVGLLQSVLTLVSFVVILWHLSGTLTLGPITLPGYMVWVAVVYALAGSLLTRLIGRPLIGLNFRLQRNEADFRFNLVRVRENAEGIALYRGEEVETSGLLGRFEHIRGTWWELIAATKRLTFFTVGFNQVAVVFPLLVSAPRYFAGEISLGVLIQIANAFGQVQSALSWFVESYASLAIWKASTDRLLTFQQRMRMARAHTEQPPVAVHADSPADLYTRQLDLQLPDGTLLLADASFCFEPRRCLMVSGPNGSGKSTLFRTIAGIWPFGRGVIHVPADARLLFLPQRPYFPIGSLRRAVSYPAEVAAFSDLEIADALCVVGLNRFADRLDEVQNWGSQMSGGEQQRLALARAVLHRPNWLFLDEASSALDEASEHDMYELLRQRLPTSTIISIAHRTQLASYHPARLVFAAAPPGGPATLVASNGAGDGSGGVLGPPGDGRPKLT